MSLEKNIFAPMKLICWGAAGSVTGSMHMLTLDNGKNILVDCGLNYEKKYEFIENNLHFPFKPESIDAVILTHAHIDHSGNLPNLVRQGFNGKIYCTSATADLTRYLLEDSLNIQLRNAEKGFKYAKKKGKSIAKNAAVLYLLKHIKQMYEQIETFEYNQEFSIDEYTRCSFYNSGHILGAASVSIEHNYKKQVRIGFTGDLGNFNSKLVKDPQPMPYPDFLISEATYGGRFHTAQKSAKEILLEEIQQTCIKYSGKLIIPAFSVGRTQAILFTLHQLFREGSLPHIKVYSDSPLAIKTTDLYAQYVHELNEEAQDFYQKHKDLFEFDQLQLLSNSQHSMYVSLNPEPCVIVSAAGMVEGGRIQEHIANHISNPFATVLIAGFCAPGTLGHELLMGKSTLFINKKERHVMARITRTDIYSAHPDHNGLLNYINASIGENIKKIILTHAEISSSQALKQSLSPIPTWIAEKGKEIILD
jgi:metallo-beta-lactamase family protein